MLTKKSTWLFPFGVALIAILLFAYYISTWRNAYNFRTAIDVCSKPFCDFAEYYYPMGESVFRISQPVEGFVYSPFVAILFSLFVPLGSGTALLLWGILQGVFIVVYLILFRRIIPAGQWIPLLFVFLTLSSFPLLHHLAWGQVGIITTVSILGALFCYERGHRKLAALLLSIGLSFKFFPVIFLLPFVIRRDVQFLFYSVTACFVLLIIVPVSLLGIDGTTRFYTALLDQYCQFDWVLSSYNSQHFPHVMFRLAKGMGFNAYPYLPFLRWIGYSIATINLGFLFLVQRAQLPYANLWSFHILFLSIPFLLFTTWPCDLVYISFAQGILIWQLSEEKKNKNTSWYVMLILLLTSIILSSIFFFNFLFFNITANYHEYGYYGAIFWTVSLLLAATYVKLLPSVLQQNSFESIRD